jgi:hypothetical protein
MGLPQIPLTAKSGCLGKGTFGRQDSKYANDEYENISHSKNLRILYWCAFGPFFDRILPTRFAEDLLFCLLSVGR